MLVLTRQIGQSIIIAEDVKITVVAIGNGRVRIGITADRSIPIVREELLEQPKAAKAEEAKS